MDTDSQSGNNGMRGIVAGLVCTLLLCLASGATAALESAVPELIEIGETLRQTEAGIELSALQEQYRNHLSDSDTDAAIETAKRIVAVSGALFGEQSAQVAAALTNLGIVQIDAGNFVAARENFSAAIRLRENLGDGIIDINLINPLKGLAQTQMALDDAETAVLLYERAIHVSHVNLGPNNLEQIPVMDALSRAHYYLGNERDADDVQNSMLRLQRRRFEPGSDQYVDALTRRAEWHATLGDYAKATAAYKSVERALREQHGGDDIRLIEPLVQLAFVTAKLALVSANERLTSPYDERELIFEEGKRAIGRAVRIARDNTDNNPRLLAETLARQGDFYMATGASRSARKPYKESWSLLSSDPGLRKARDRLFDTPRPVKMLELRSTHDADSAGRPVLTPDRGFVEVRYNVTAFGRPVGLEVIDSEPAGLMDDYVVSRLRRFVFRPRFEDGTAVEYTGAIYRHPFRYSVERLSPNDRELIEETERERAVARPAVEDEKTLSDTAAIEKQPSDPSQTSTAEPAPLSNR